jgi:uncharacterized repeat protein (TIGR03803 family)
MFSRVRKLGFSYKSLQAAIPVVSCLLSALLIVIQPAQAQTYSVLYNFTGGQDGAAPRAGVTLDQAGNLYGTTSAGADLGGNCIVDGLEGCGTVFQLKHSNSGWLFNPLYIFDWSDGASPYARVVFGPDGSLYGTTAYGGHRVDDCHFRGCGVVFKLQPPATVCKAVLCPWMETVLFVFRYDLGTGGNPYYGDLVFNDSGDTFGTTNYSTYGGGQVFQLTPSDGGWNLSLLFVFGYLSTNGTGTLPDSGVIFDGAGNLYGTTPYGGPYQYGLVYELTPSASGWMEQILYGFQDGSDGGVAAGGVVFDQSGNLYGTTQTGGSGGGGTVYELSPSNGGWTLTTLHSFAGSLGSFAVLTMDASGNLYGTTFLDGAYGQGNVFELSPSNGSWIYTSLHDFTGGSDGGRPFGQVTLDANGNLYGTASMGGANGNGVVWEITQ